MTPKLEDRLKTENELLFEGVAQGVSNAVEDRLNLGTSPDIRDDMNRTPLMKAAEAGTVEVVEQLLRHGADVNAVDAGGETALMAAAYGDHADAAKLLVSSGADLNIRNNEGYSALEIARDMDAKVVLTYLASHAAAPAGASKTANSAVRDEDEASVGNTAVQDSSEPESNALGLDLDLIPEPIRSTYFESPEAEPQGEGQEEGNSVTDADESGLSEGLPGTNEGAVKASHPIILPKGSQVQKNRDESQALPDKIREVGEERLVYDELENKYVWGVNETAKASLICAGMEIGAYSVDTVFKGSYMAVLKPRSQEFKRFRKLWKHPDLLLDSRWWKDWTGAEAVRRYCLAEGKDVSNLTGAHLMALYYVKDLKLLLVLAEEANAGQYTVRQLKIAIENLRADGDDQDAGKIIIKTLDQAPALLEDPDLVELCTDKERVLTELSKTQRKKIRALIKARKTRVDEWKNVMDTFETILSELEGG